MKFYIRTYGCQMNERDSEAATAMLVEKGFEPVVNENEADILIFNTCSVREQAELKAIGKIGLLKRLKRSKPDIFIGIIGCMAQNYGEKLLEDLPHVDFVLGTGQLHTLPEVISCEIRKREKQVRLDDNEDVITSLGQHYNVTNQISAYIAIMRGCNRFCSYCIVPYVRGREKSRTPNDVVKEAKELIEKGVKELFLLGQNVSAFGLDGKPPPPSSEHSPFADLLEKLNELGGLERIRFTSPHPAFFNDKLINAIAELPKVCKGIHLPLQSGSDRILKAMNRPYTSVQYLEIINKLKARSPGITFSTDIIVGFPGETEEDFRNTQRVMKEVEFDNAYIFKYSPRKGTAAAKLKDSVPKQVKEERNQILLKDLQKMVTKHNNSLINTTQEILVEGPSKRNETRWAGRTSTNKVVVFTPSPEINPGDIIKLSINRATSMTLYGGMI